MPNENKEQPGGENSGAGRAEKLLPRDWHPVDAFDPKTGGKCQLYVDDHTMTVTGRLKGKGATLELADIVLQTVQGKWFASAWRGVTDYDSEEGDENWRVYVSSPPHAYDHETGRRVDPWKGELFLVFADGDGLIRWWHWDDADTKNPKFPIDYDLPRFKEHVL